MSEMGLLWGVLAGLVAIGGMLGYIIYLLEEQKSPPRILPGGDNPPKSDS